METILFLGMPCVKGGDNGTVEENLLALRRSDTVLLPVLFGVVLVPLKARAFLKKVKNIHTWLVYDRHIQKSIEGGVVIGGGAVVFLKG